MVNYNDIRSDIPEFDDAIGGSIPGQFIVIGTLPTMGISDFLISLIVGLGINHSIPVRSYHLKWRHHKSSENY